MLFLAETVELGTGLVGLLVIILIIVAILYFLRRM